VTKQPDIADWFYIAAWENSPLSQSSPPEDTGPWLVFTSMSRFNQTLVELLQRCGIATIVVQPGAGFHKLGEAAYQIEPTDAQAYVRLLDDIEHTQGLPAHILHAWSLTADSEPLALGYLSVILLAQALNGHSALRQTQLNVLTPASCLVTGGEEIRPEYAMVFS